MAKTPRVRAWGTLWVVLMWSCADTPSQLDTGADGGGSTDGSASDAELDATTAPDAGQCDADHDGFRAATCGGNDCDDGDALRYPGNAERCSGNLVDGRPAASHDEDCNPCTVAASGSDGDADGDRYARVDCANPYERSDDVLACDTTLVVVHDGSHGEPRTVSGGDCIDDASLGGGAVHPNQPEVCFNSIDDNCDGGTDSGTFFRDLDNDLRGDPRTSMTGACALGWVANAEDCDDLRAQTYVGARELCDGRDNDCSLSGTASGGADATEDADGDGHTSPFITCLGRGEPAAPAEARFSRDDCDDTDAAIHPGAGSLDVCGNGVDDDCNGTIDDPSGDVFRDRDGDGFGETAAVMHIMSCAVPSGYVRLDGDCDDLDATRSPGNLEICDGIDDDCSTPSTREALQEDADRDGHTAVAASCLGGSGVPGTFSKDDCDDAAADRFPGATEYCDGVDSDCSSGGARATDEDADLDGHSPPGGACLGRSEGAPPTAFFEDDCDDGRAGVHGGLPASADTSTCDGLDNDCDPSTSELTLPDGCAHGYCTEGALCVRALTVVDYTDRCAAYANGTIECWGGNFYGQLGDGTTTDALAPVRVSGITRAIRITAGGQHSCALVAGGSVQCWGRNDFGQVGDGSGVSPRLAPRSVVGLTTATQLDAGEEHTCALLRDRTLRCWGGNASGPLGDGTRLNRGTPVTPAIAEVRRVVSGGGHTCAQHVDGSVDCWGYGGFGQLGTAGFTDVLIPTPLPGIGAVGGVGVGYNHTCILFGDGTVGCAGRTNYGQLGRGFGGFGGRADFLPIAGLTGAADLSVRFDDACVRYASGAVSCWGRNDAGQIGDGTTTSAYLPVPIGSLPPVGRILAGSTALAGGSALYASGNIVGDGTSVLRLSPTRTATGVTAVFAAEWATCVLLGGGRLGCWGDNRFGRLGDGTTASHLTLTMVPGAIGVVDVGVGIEHGCALADDGAVSCWGSNSSGNLGNGTRTDRLTPGPVMGLGPAVDIDIEYGTSCARLADGTVACWGYNSTGSIGDGTFVDRLTPYTLPISGARDVNVGVFHACAVDGAGAAWCMGQNNDGRLGDGTTTTRTTPTRVVGIPPVTRVAAGADTTCAMTAGGAVYCWGSGWGIRPVLVTMPGPAIGLREVSYNTCAALASGRGVCWSPGGTPTDVGLPNVAMMAPGISHTCALQNDGSLYCWGSNESGEVGDGTTEPVAAPTLLWQF